MVPANNVQQLSARLQSVGLDAWLHWAPHRMAEEIEDDGQQCHVTMG